MKLWEAMLEGAKQGPQLFGQLWNYDHDGGSCAISAVGRGMGESSRVPALFLYPRLAAWFPELRDNESCPDCGSSAIPSARGEAQVTDLLTVIVHLNNNHRWSRQRIAEWLANRKLKFKPAPEAKQCEKA